MNWGNNMKNILLILSSPKTESSASTLFAKEFVSHIQERVLGSCTTVRDLSNVPIPHVTNAHTVASEKPAEKWTPEDQLALQLSDVLIEELESADCLVIATPMHNYMVPSVLKAWIDHVVRAHRTLKLTPQGKIGMIADKKTFVIVSSGGHHTHKPAWQPDFLTPYLTEILRTVGITSVEFIYLEAMNHGPVAAEAAVSEARIKATQTISTVFS
jgi:FMN-dependent NADH-azoreductase